MNINGTLISRVNIDNKHVLNKPENFELSYLRRQESALQKAWIPACAGMTLLLFDALRPIVHSTPSVERDGGVI